MAIRPASLDDLPEIARRLLAHYPNRATRETVLRGAKWMCWAIGSPDRLVLIGPNSFGIAQIGIFYGCEVRASVDILCSSPRPGAAFESLRMVRKMLAWAHRRGAPSLKLDADTGVDFEPFARRLGATKTEVNKYHIPV